MCRARRQVFLDQHAVVLEAGGGLALAARERRGEIRRAIDAPHALAAAAGHRLDEHRESRCARACVSR